MHETSTITTSTRREANSNNRNKQLRFVAVLVVLITSGIFVNVWQQTGEAAIKRQPLRGLPVTIGDWQAMGADLTFDRDVEDVLQTSDYLLRNYKDERGRYASLYVGYYNTQRSGATYHSPLNCLPGSGWTLTEPARASITPVDNSPAFDANHYIIARGRDRQLLLYWYAGRGRNTASEYRDKINTVIDSITRRRSDGSIVRVLVPVSPNGDQTQAEQVALRAAQDFAAQLTPQLYDFVPR